MSIRITPTITLYERSDWGARHWRDFTHQGSPDEAFIHHSTDRLAEHVDTLAEMKAIMKAIQRFHMDTNGWDDIAYHAVVFQPYGHRKYARIFQGRPIDHVPAAQALHNNGTLAVCVVGNFDHDDSVKDNTRHAIEVFLGTVNTLRTVGGHRDVVNTECPGDTLYRQVPIIARASHLKLYRTPSGKTFRLDHGIHLVGDEACGTINACGAER